MGSLAKWRLPLMLDMIQTTDDQRFVSSTGNIEVLLSHTYSIVCALACF